MGFFFCFVSRVRADALPHELKCRPEGRVWLSSTFKIAALWLGSSRREGGFKILGWVGAFSMVACVFGSRYALHGREGV